MIAPRGLAGLTLGTAVGSDLALTFCLSVVFRFLIGGDSSDFLESFTTISSLRRRLRSDGLESACCIKQKVRKRSCC